MLPQIINNELLNEQWSNCFSAMVGQSKLVPPEKMKHSIKLVDDQMNWCDSAMEVSRLSVVVESFLFSTFFTSCDFDVIW